MEAITAANILSTGTEEIPAKHSKSSGIRCLCLLRWLAILYEFCVSGQNDRSRPRLRSASIGCQRPA